MIRFRPLTFLALFIPIAITLLLLLRPSPLNLIVAGTVWVFSLAIALQPSAFEVKAELGYWFSASTVAGGFLAFGYAVLFALAHSMDPIGPRADWWPFTFFGGLIAMAGGLLMLVLRKR